MAYLSSSIGKKQVQAVAGLLLCGFLVAHLLGNLLLLRGAETFNAYAARLAGLGAVLYLGEAGLAACFLIHLGLGILVAIENRKARPVSYNVAARSGRGATTASRTMLVTGVAILVFLVVHLWMFKSANSRASRRDCGRWSSKS